MKKLKKISESFEKEVVGDILKKKEDEPDALEVAGRLAGRMVSIIATGECDRPQDIDPLLNSVKGAERSEAGKVRLRVGGRTGDWEFDVEEVSVRSLADGGQVRCGNYTIALS